MSCILNIKHSKSKLNGLLMITFCITLFVACQKEKAIHAPIINQEDPVSVETEIKTLASAFNLQAYSEEEKVTRRLQDLAKTHQAKLQGLEHRLKTKSSTLRKLKKMHFDAR